MRIYTEKEEHNLLTSNDHKKKNRFAIWKRYITRMQAFNNIMLFILQRVCHYMSLCTYLLNTQMITSIPFTVCGGGGGSYDFPYAATRVSLAQVDKASQKWHKYLTTYFTMRVGGHSTRLPLIRRAGTKLCEVEQHSVVTVIKKKCPKRAQLLNK